MSKKLQTVHVRINDAATGQPTPCRVRFTDAEGKYYAPFGRLREFDASSCVEVGSNVKIDGEAWAYIDGTCEIELPPGQITVDVAKGPEYRPLHMDVSLPTGKLSLRLTIERWVDLRSESWYSGDTRCHYLSPHAALLEGAAEDLAVVNLLACDALARDSDIHNAFPNIVEFSGQHPALEMPGHLVVVNTLNVHDGLLGCLILLNCHRIVFPLAFGGRIGFDNWTLKDWCDQCHRKGGLVIGDNFLVPVSDDPHGELLPNVIAGRVDALQVFGFDYPETDAKYKRESCLREWYRLLDVGLRVPLVAGSGKTDNRNVLGQLRTYAYLGLGASFTYQNWIEAIRAGRSFVTNGPILTLQVNESLPGAVVDVVRSSADVHVRAEVRSVLPFRRIEVLANDRVVATAGPQGDPPTALLETEVKLEEGGWIVARCYGDFDDTKEQWTAAQTSPVYVEVEGRRPSPDPALIDGFLAKLDTMLKWVDEKGRFENDQQRQRLAAVFEEAREILLRRRG